MSEYTTVELLLFQLLLIFFNAVFAGAEIAVISVNNNKLRKMADQGDRRAKRLLSLTIQPAKFLATIQVGVTLAGFLGSAFAADNFSDKVVDWLLACGVPVARSKLDVLAVIGITVILSYFTLILGEIVPKRIAMKNPEKISLAVSWFLYAIAAVSTPLICFLTVSTNAVLRLIGINPNVENRKVTEEEVRIMIDACSEGGGIDDIEKKMLNNVFEFDDKRVRDVMTYRLDVAFLNADDPKEKWEKIMVKTRYSVYPVYRQNKDNVVGVITIKDYLKYKKLSEAEIIKKAVKPAQITIDTLHIDELFINMQKSRNHFAVVVDEYGSITGIVTMKDLLEELVGELGNDTVLPPEDPMVEKIDDHTWLIKGSASLKEVSAALKVKFPPNDCTTFAGLLFALMDNIPQNKKNVKLQYGRLKIKIPQIRARRIEEAIVRLSDN